MKSSPNAFAISRASVVLPTPGGPHRIIECGRPDSKATRSGLPGPSRCDWPTTSSIVLRSHPLCERRAGGLGREEILHGWVRSLDRLASRPAAGTHVAAGAGRKDETMHRWVLVR